MGKHLHNDLAEKNSKAFVILVVPVVTPLINTDYSCHTKDVEFVYHTHLYN